MLYPNPYYNEECCKRFVCISGGRTGIFDIEELVTVLESVRARDIAVIKIPDEIDFANYMVIVTALSYRHIKAITEDIKWIVSSSWGYSVAQCFILSALYMYHCMVIVAALFCRHIKAITEDVKWIVSSGWGYSLAQYLNLSAQ